MFIQDLRPKFFRDVVGGGINNDILMSIAKSGGPSTIIIAGDYGCGKSTSSRLFARAVNCKNLTNDLCGCCEACTCKLDTSAFYQELDSSIFGNVDTIRDMRSQLQTVPKGMTRVINIDEFHLCSRQCMSSLLKVFEDAPSNIYYILTTTDIDAIIPTIISRSMVLKVNTKSKFEVMGNIRKLAKELNINISDSAVETIANNSHGHMRNAHMALEKYTLVGEEKFLESESTAYPYIAKYFYNLLACKMLTPKHEKFSHTRENVFKSLSQIMTYPVALLKDEYQRFFLDLVKGSVDDTYKVDPETARIIGKFKTKDLIDLFKIGTGDWVIKSFDNDVRLQTALLALFQKVVME